jgi:parallel beta-helix repeat protein
VVEPQLLTKVKMTTLDLRGASLSLADPPISTNPNADLAWKAPVRVATTGGNINLQTIGLGTVDGVTLAAGDRVLVKDQTDATTNGLYNAATGTWTRTIDANNNSQWARGVQVAVTDGATNIGTNWKCTATSPITLGTTTLTFVQSVTLATTSLWLNIQSFGGIDDGVTDNTTPLNNALAALTGQGGGIYFPSKLGLKYKLNSGITFNFPAGIFSVTLVGAGQDATELTWPNASGGITFNYNNTTSSVHIRDMSLTTGVAGGGDAIKLNYATTDTNPALTAQTDFYRVTCRGSDGYAVTNYWSNGVNVVNVSNILFDDLAVIGPAAVNGNGINLIGDVAATTYAVQFNVRASDFIQLTSGIVYGSYIQGVTVSDGTNFNACTRGIIAPGSQVGSLSQLAVTGCQFAPATGGIGIVALTAIVEVMITNCLFIIESANSEGIQLTPNNHFTITGNEITSGNSTLTNGIIVGTSSGAGTISGNDIFGFTTGILLESGSANVTISGNAIEGVATGIVLQAGSTNCSVQGNTASITNSGTGHVIIDNVGYNPVGPAAITVNANPFTYTAGASPETVYIYAATNLTSVTFDKNGGLLGTVAATSVPCTVELGPYEQLKITFSAGNVATVNKMVH